jgi:hypothetical protein
MLNVECLMLNGGGESVLFLYICSMNKEVKIYKPSNSEILNNVLQSFEIEHIHISHKKGLQIFERLLKKLKKGNV